MVVASFIAGMSVLNLARARRPINRAINCDPVGWMLDSVSERVVRFAHCQRSFPDLGA